MENITMKIIEGGGDFKTTWNGAKVSIKKINEFNKGVAKADRYKTGTKKNSILNELKVELPQFGENMVNVPPFFIYPANKERKTKDGNGKQIWKIANPISTARNMSQRGGKQRLSLDLQTATIDTPFVSGINNGEPAPTIGQFSKKDQQRIFDLYESMNDEDEIGNPRTQYFDDKWNKDDFPFPPKQRGRPLPCPKVAGAKPKGRPKKAPEPPKEKKPRGRPRTNPIKEKKPRGRPKKVVAGETRIINTQDELIEGLVKQSAAAAGKGVGEDNAPLDTDLYEEVKKEADTKYKKNSAYKNGWIVKTYKSRGGKYSGDRPTNEGLDRWYKEDWKDIGNKEYPVYRPTKKITKKTPLTPDEIDKKNLEKQIKLKQRYKGKKNLPPFQAAGGRINPPTPPQPIQQPTQEQADATTAIALQQFQEDQIEEQLDNAGNQNIDLEAEMDDAQGDMEGNGLGGKLFSQPQCIRMPRMIHMSGGMISHDSNTKSARMNPQFSTLIKGRGRNDFENFFENTFDPNKNNVAQTFAPVAEAFKPHGKAQEFGEQIGQTLRENIRPIIHTGVGSLISYGLGDPTGLSGYAAGQAGLNRGIDEGLDRANLGFGIRGKGAAEDYFKNLGNALIGRGLGGAIYNPNKDPAITRQNNVIRENMTKGGTKHFGLRKDGFVVSPEVMGKGVRPHMVKGSAEAKAYMKSLRDRKKKMI